MIVNITDESITKIRIIANENSGITVVKVIVPHASEIGVLNST